MSSSTSICTSQKQNGNDRANGRTTGYQPGRYQGEDKDGIGTCLAATLKKTRKSILNIRQSQAEAGDCPNTTTKNPGDQNS
ncbi:MAG TPA: hypothetical protein VKA46_32605 [Gemmataceae bacterium]|nr:hypothetical protein [Gemmataceae bacterium]